MTILFNRVATVIAQHPDHPDITIQNLRIQFDIEKFFTNTANVGTITIYNLNPENRRLLVKRKSDIESAPFTTINLIAGYTESNALIFRGDLVQGFSIRQGPDWITTLQCTTAFDQFVSAHHGPEDSSEEITAFDLLARLLGTSGLVDPVDTNVAINNATLVEMSFEVSETLRQERISGTAYSGRVLDTIVKMLARYGMKISIDDFEALIAIQFRPVNPEDEQTAPLINIASGLLGSPQITEVGVKVTTLLNTQIRVAKLFRIESETTQQNDIRELPIQTFTCFKLKHSGDTHSDTWTSEILGAWYPEIDFEGSKNVTPSPLELPQLQALPPEPDPPEPVPPL